VVDSGPVAFLLCTECEEETLRVRFMRLNVGSLAIVVVFFAVLGLALSGEPKPDNPSTWLSCVPDGVENGRVELECGDDRYDVHVNIPPDVAPNSIQMIDVGWFNQATLRGKSTATGADVDFSGMIESD
jgi:hypothetical protein